MIAASSRAGFSLKRLSFFVEQALPLQKMVIVGAIVHQCVIIFVNALLINDSAYYTLHN